MSQLFEVARNIVKEEERAQETRAGEVVAAAFSWAQECLGYQDPWDGCEDLASEGLAEWEKDFQRMNASLVQDVEFLAQAPAGCSSMCSRQDKGNIFQRESTSTLSTAASLECSTSRSRGSGFTPMTSVTTMTSSSELEGTENKPGEDSDENDAWELEFMMRAKMDAAKAGNLLKK